MPTTASSRGYNDYVQQGPYDVWFLMAVTPASPFIGDKVVMDWASMTPDSTTYTGALCLGLVDKDGDIDLESKPTPIGADQFTESFSDYVEQESAKIGFTAKQWQQTIIQNLMSGVSLYATATGRAANAGGGLNEPVYGAYALIAPQRGAESTSAHIILLYRALVKPAIKAKFGRKSQAMLPFEINGRTDITRAAGKQIWAVSHEAASGTLF